MAIYGLSDLHLAIDTPDKSMEVFGGNWKDYIRRIGENVRAKVTDGDTILMPGDLSWVMYLNDGKKDFSFIDSLPGTKLIGRGNHDYFWSTAKKMENYFAAEGLNTIKIVKNNAIPVEDSLVTGTRGWKMPADDGFKDEDRKILDREIGRFRLCLDALDKEDPSHEKRHIVMTHYPVWSSNAVNREVDELFESHHVDLCIYGHLHGRAHSLVYEGTPENRCTKYVCVSADYINFDPVKL